MAEFVKDVECPTCGFPRASLYQDDGVEFTDCGHCNFNSARGDSPTPERTERLDWERMQRWFDAELEWLDVDPALHHHLPWTPTMRDEAHWYACERDRLGLEWKPGESQETRAMKTFYAAEKAWRDS